MNVITKTKYDPEEYEAEAAKLEEVFTKLLTDKDLVHSLLHTEDATSFTSDLQILHDRTGLVGRCTITIESPVRVQLDKSRISAYIKGNTDWPAMRIEKKGTFADD